MSVTLLQIQSLLKECSPEEQRTIFKQLRATNQLHQLESDLDAPAEIILEAIHRAPELTRRMLRGVIADAAFAQFIVPTLGDRGWRDVTPVGNFAFDHLLQDSTGQVSIQVKLQRSEKGQPVITNGRKSGLPAGQFMVETQRTRGGKTKDADGNEKKTRPYRYGDFDLIAVSLYPSTKDWKSFRYTVGDWLLQGADESEMATYQPVSMAENERWTDDFGTAVQWLRSKEKRRVID